MLQLLRQPLMFLPRALSATTDAQNAIGRLKKIFHAPLASGEPFDINPDQKLAVEVRGATFEWEEGASVREARESKDSKAKGKMATKQPTGNDDGKDAPPFQVVDIDLLVLRGSLIAVVGSVGSGKVKYNHAVVSGNLLRSFCSRVCCKALLVRCAK